MAYQSYRDLEIYKKAHKLAIEIHEMSLQLPRFEMYEEGSQIRKSSKSVKGTCPIHSWRLKKAMATPA